MREYWVVYPSQNLLQQFVLGDKNKYQLYENLGPDDILSAHTLPDLKINLAEVFAD